MKILLIRPKPSPETIGLQHLMVCEPLELEYLCGAVADLPCDTRIVDMILEKKSIATVIEEEKPDIVGITAYITHIPVVRDYCRQVKEQLPRCLTVVGGVHAEVVPEDFDDPSIDIVVSANGIETFRDIVKAVLAKDDPSNITGVWHRGEPKCRKAAAFGGYRPDRSKVARYRPQYYYLFHKPCALIKTSFGCPYQCNFCFCRHVTDGQYFERPIADVIDELRSISERDVYIVDDNFLVSRDRVVQFCDELQAAGLDKKFLIYGRADFIAANEDVIRRFARLGLRAVIVGLESCNTDELDAYNKRSDSGCNEAAVQILARCGVDCYGTLILGIDWTDDDFNSLSAWLRRMGLVYVNLQPFTPLPGTERFSEYSERLRTSRAKHEKWDLAHLVVEPTGMSVRRYYWNILKVYYRVSMRAGNLLGLSRKYGLRENLKLLAGSLRVSWQYLRKAVIGS